MPVAALSAPSRRVQKGMPTGCTILSFRRVCSPAGGNGQVIKAEMHNLYPQVRDLWCSPLFFQVSPGSCLSFERFKRSPNGAGVRNSATALQAPELGCAWRCNGTLACCLRLPSALPGRPRYFPAGRGRPAVIKLRSLMLGHVVSERAHQRPTPMVARHRRAGGCQTRQNKLELCAGAPPAAQIGAICFQQTLEGRVARTGTLVQAVAKRGARRQIVLAGLGPAPCSRQSCRPGRE